MTIIDQLEKNVTSVVLKNETSVAHLTLLEQFYAILIARLASPHFDGQWCQSVPAVTNTDIKNSLRFEQLWQNPSTQAFIIEELATMHHVDETTTTNLLKVATPLVYRELKILASDQFLPAFLQDQQSMLRHYLPPWSASVITDFQDLEPTSTTEPHIVSNPKEATDALVNRHGEQSYTEHPIQTHSQIATATDHIAATSDVATDDHSEMLIDASHATSFAQHGLNSRIHPPQQSPIYKNKKYKKGLLFILLPMVLLMALAAFWFLETKTRQVATVTPSATPPVVIPPSSSSSAETLTPVELLIGVDNEGSLYTCHATVGDAHLQGILQRALNTSFGGQASICVLTINSKTANHLANLPTEALPNVMLLLRSTPFARLHLQNDHISLEAPDHMLLQRLLTEMRTTLPAMTIDTSVALPSTSDNSNTIEMNKATMDTVGANQLETKGSETVANPQYPNNQAVNNSGSPGTTGYQSPYDNVNNRNLSIPENNNNRENNTVIESPIDRSLNPLSSSARSPNPAATNRASATSSGSISLSEVEDMANNVIIAEPAQANRPADNRIQ